MTSATWAYGSQLQRGDGGDPTEVFTAVAELTSLTPLSMSRDEIDVTSHQSADGYREFLPGLRDAGEIEFEANWLPTDATQDESTGLLAGFNSDGVENFRIIVSNAGTTIGYISCSGFLTAFETDLPVDAQAQLSGTIKLSGEPTWTDGAPS